MLSELMTSRLQMNITWNDHETAAAREESRRYHHLVAAREPEERSSEGCTRHCWQLVWYSPRLSAWMIPNGHRRCGTVLR